MESIKFDPSHVEEVCLQLFPSLFFSLSHKKWATDVFRRRSEILSKASSLHFDNGSINDIQLTVREDDHTRVCEMYCIRRIIVS
jgi:hypothetical protein